MLLILSKSLIPPETVNRYSDETSPKLLMKQRTHPSPALS